MNLPRVLTIVSVIFALVLPSYPALSERFAQQGPKLVAAGAGQCSQGIGVALSSDGNTALVSGYNCPAWVYTRSNGIWAQQAQLNGTGGVMGYAAALSADGNTAIIGGIFDNGSLGAAWVFTRSNGVWSQQGPKLVGTGYSGSSEQGFSVALSADGNTALVGGPADGCGSPCHGAAWVFTRTNGVWTQQGNKLVGSGGNNEQQGVAVALSADGNTALIGGWTDYNQDLAGATWVFTRFNGVWSQQGEKLVGTGADPTTGQGHSVALSADGNTAIIGGFGNDGPGPPSVPGAAWVFARSNLGVWTQQGDKLVGTGAVGKAGQGSSVALSADGNTAIVGGFNDNAGVGAAWLFTRSNAVWTQQGNKLVGTNPIMTSNQGWAAALSADGKTAIIGGYRDNSSTGAAWVFVNSVVTKQTAATHDFNADSLSDIAWRDGSGNVAFWEMNGATVHYAGGIGGVPASWFIVGQRDFDGDGNFDLLWRDTSGNTAIWFMNGTQVGSSVAIGNIPTSWSVVGTGDFDGDGAGDILWTDGSGNYAVWLMDGATVVASAGLGNVPTSWSVVGAGDFNGDGKTDLLWRDTGGNIAMWFLNGTALTSAASVGNIGLSWMPVGTGDFNGDGKSDIVWRDSAGVTAIWLMNGAVMSSGAGLGTVPTSWSIALTGDYNGDGKSDLLWRDNLGNNAMWFMNGVAIASTGTLFTVPTNWTVQSVNAD